MDAEFNWKDSLEQLFAATVNQEPIEDAAKLMASFSAVDESYHEECVFLFKMGKSLANEKDQSIIKYINESGYSVSSFDEAHALLADFEMEYLKAYGAARAALSPHSAGELSRGL
jgi:hypothetical protein